MNTNFKQILAVTVLAGTVLIACKSDDKKNAEMTDKIPGIALENMDTTVSPKADFYDYVNGNWLKTNTIPEDETRWGNFETIGKSTKKEVLNISKVLRTLTHLKIEYSIILCLSGSIFKNVIFDFISCVVY